MEAVQNATWVSVWLHARRSVPSWHHRRLVAPGISVFMHLNILYPSRLSLCWCHGEKTCQVQIQQKWKQMFWSSKKKLKWISTQTAEPLFEIVTDAASQFHSEDKSVFMYSILWYENVSHHILYICLFTVLNSVVSLIIGKHIYFKFISSFMYFRSWYFKAVDLRGLSWRTTLITFQPYCPFTTCLK